MSEVIGMHDLITFLKEFPENVQRRVCRMALKKAAVVVVAEAQKLYPRQTKLGRVWVGKRKSIPKTYHTADMITNKAWNKPDYSMQLISTASGYGRLNHLVEDGTADRFHNSFTPLRTMVVGTRIKNRRVKQANGGYKTVKEVASQSIRRGQGSRDRLTGSKLREGRGKYVGRMPARHPLARAMSNTSTQVQDIIATEVRAGLDREIARNNSST